MKLTAIAREDLEGMGFGLLSNKIGLELNGKVIPDSYGECIGRYYVNDDVYKSFLRKIMMKIIHCILICTKIHVKAFKKRGI